MKKRLLLKQGQSAELSDDEIEDLARSVWMVDCPHIELKPRAQGKPTLVGHGALSQDNSTALTPAPTLDLNLSWMTKSRRITSNENESFIYHQKLVRLEFALLARTSKGGGWLSWKGLSGVTGLRPHRVIRRERGLWRPRGAVGV